MEICLDIYRAQEKTKQNIFTLKQKNMKTIESIQTWVNGKSVYATVFNMYPIGGVLGSSASFYYSLLDEDLIMVSQGNLTMDGEAYQDWGNDDEYAWEWAASPAQLNLTITGDFIPPVPPEPTPEPTPIVEEVVASEEPIA